MEFIELTEKEYTKYWENHPNKTFLSSPKISKLREKSNWKTSYVGVKEDKKIIAATIPDEVRSNIPMNSPITPNVLTVSIAP